MIELNGKKMCTSCFREIGSLGECGCGYYKDNSENALKKGTILNGRYIVGMQVESSDTFIRYLCYDSIDNITVFIKEFFPEYYSFKRNGNSVDVDGKSLNSYNFAMQKAIEATKKAQMINSSFSPTVLKAFFENNTAYFVTEVHMLDRVSEYTKINHCITCEEAVNYLHQFLTFLSEVNECGIMHGGINDNTVYINKEEGSIFIDGFDCDSSDVCIDSTMILQPNCYSHVKKYTNKKSVICDVFSVGAVLYKLLTRKTPEAEGLPEERFDSFAIEKTADKELLQFIKNMCGFNKQEYCSFYDVVRDANRLFRKYRLPEIEVTEMVTSMPGSEAKSNNNKKTIIIAVISVVILSIIIGVTAFSLKKRSEKPEGESTSVSDIAETDETEADETEADETEADETKADGSADDETKKDKTTDKNSDKAAEKTTELKSEEETSKSKNNKKNSK